MLENTSVAVDGGNDPRDRTGRRPAPEIHGEEDDRTRAARSIMPGLDRPARPCRRRRSSSQVAEHYPGPNWRNISRLHRLSLLARMVVPRLAVLEPREAEVRHDHEPVHARLRAAIGQSRIRLRQCRGRREDRHPLDYRRRPVAPALSARLHLLGKRPARRPA